MSPERQEGQMSEAGPNVAERRAHPRVPTRFSVHCRRLGRGGVDRAVEVVDLSMGGVRITAPAALHLGDVVELMVDEGAGPFTLSGLVVSISAVGAEARYGHIAFTRITPLVLEQIAHLVDDKRRT